MPLRSLWKGSIHFSLVSIPVEAYTAAEPGEGEIHFHQLHRDCHSRIKYVKTCPIHGPVSNDEIVSGYEYEKGQYVIFERDELDYDRGKSDRAITIDTFITPDEIDPLYYDGRTYYLAPESAAEKPYAVLGKALEKMHRYGVARIVLHGKDELALLRPIDGVLSITMLHYQSQVRSPELIAQEIPHVKASPQEQKLAEQLIAATTTDKFNFSQYEDARTQHLKELVEAKIAGRQVVVQPEAEEETHVINLMDALRKSVQNSKRGGKSTAKTAQARKALSSHLSHRHKTATTAPRRRKIS
jgi:DNA end-binding protein Ku